MNEHNLRWIPARVLVDGVFPCFVMACVGRGICRKEEYRNSSTANTSRTTPSEFVDSRATPEAVWTMTVARLLIKSKIPREYSASSVLPIVDCSHSPNLPPMLRRVAPFFCIGSTCTKAYCGASPFAFSLTIAICLQLDHRRKSRVVRLASPPVSYSVGGLVEHWPVEG